jgi:hypothetical protein
VRSLSMADGLRQALLNDVRMWGAEGVETGGFLLSPPNQPISVLALAGTAGVTRRKDLLRISAASLAQLFVWAGDRELYVAAQAHSHAGYAFLSETDVRHGFSVTGFTTTVIPYFASPPEDLQGWGWWRYECEWKDVEAPWTIAGDATIIYFDEDGVDER